MKGGLYPTILPSGKPSNMTLYLRSLPFLLGVGWEIIGESVKPWQVQLRKYQTLLIHIRTTLAIIKKNVLLVIMPYLPDDSLLA